MPPPCYWVLKAKQKSLPKLSAMMLTCEDKAQPNLLIKFSKINRGFCRIFIMKNNLPATPPTNNDK